MNRRMRLGLLLAGCVIVAGCGRRQGVESVPTGQPLAVPNDTGGYAGAMADPPKEQYIPDVEQNIAAGEATDIREREFMNREVLKKLNEKEAAEHPQDGPPPPSDTSRDGEWASNPKPVIAVETNQGVFYLELWPDVAPKHSANLIKLAEQKFYDGIKIHRVEPGFVVQAGDPFTRFLPIDDPQVGSGGPGWSVPAEFSNKPHLRGTLSMARTSDPNSAGSQFFICLDRAPTLDRQYTVFGRVLGEGMTIVDKIKVGDRINYLRVVHK